MAALTQKWRANRKLVTSELRKIAAEHAEIPGSKLTLIPDDPKKYEGQGIERKVPAHKDANPEVVRALAITAEPMFQGMVEIARKQQEETGIISFTGEFLRSNHTLKVVTLHEDAADATDIAFGQAALQCVLAEKGYYPNFGIVISKIMPHLGYRFDEAAEAVPTVDALQYMGDIFFSFPRTKTIRESAIADDLVGTYNANMRWQASHASRHGNYVLGAAPTGTRGKPDEADPSLIHIPHVSPASAKLMSGLVLPLVIRLQQEQPIFQILPPRAVNGLDDMNATMEALCRATEEVADDGSRLLFHPYEEAA